MDATEAVLIAHDHFYGVPGMHPDLGFEAASIASIDEDWYVKCRVFSLLTSKMVGYLVIINDCDKEILSIERIE
jgi:hypothetical protein